MPDMGALAVALSSLKAAKDIAEAMVSLRDTAAFQSKLIEFQGKIIDANNASFAAQDERVSLLERVGALEKQVTDLKAWEAQKQRYQMEQVYTGATAFVLKPEAQGTEPIHWLCARCYNEGKPSLLQLGPKYSDNAGRIKGWECPTCDRIIYVRYDISPGKTATF